MLGVPAGVCQTLSGTIRRNDKVPMKNFIKNFAEKYQFLLLGVGLAIMAQATPGSVAWIAQEMVGGIPEESWLSPTTWGNNERILALRDSATMLGQVGAVLLLVAGGIVCGVGLVRLREASTEAEEIEERRKRVELLFSLEERVGELEAAVGPAVPPQLPPSATAPAGASHPRNKQQQTTAAP